MALMEVITALQSGQPLPEPDRLELAKALDRYQRGEAFTFAGAARIRERNKALIAAADTLPGTPWTKAGTLERAVHYFERRVWPRVKSDDDPSLTGIHAHLFRAFKSGARPLRSRRRIYELIR